MKTKKAFTLVELLVVIAVIALLMSVLMPALRMARDHAMRVLCGNNIRQLLTACTIYADRNEGRVPVEPDQPVDERGWWPWDVSVTATNQLMESMGKKITDFMPRQGTPAWNSNEPWIPVQEVFYCPANTQQKRNKEIYWNYAVTAGNTSISGFRILGYIPLWRDRYNNNGNTPIYNTVDPYNMQTTSEPNPTKKWISRIDIPQASEAEFIADCTLSQLVDVINEDPLDPAKYPNGSFLVTLGYNPGGYGTPDQTNHMINDSKAAGGCIGFVDNHVEWRPFNQMQARFVQDGLSDADGPIWWW